MRLNCRCIRCGDNNSVTGAGVGRGSMLYALCHPCWCLFKYPTKSICPPYTDRYTMWSHVYEFISPELANKYIEEWAVLDGY